MEDREQEAQDEVQLPEERVEDLEPGADEAKDVSGGRMIKSVEISNIKAGDA